MLRPSTIERIDAHWAAYLGCSLADLREARVTVISHGSQLVAYRGVYALCAMGSGLVISAPDEFTALLHARCSRRKPATAFDARRIATVLRARAGIAVGPASLAYADGASFRPAVHAHGARELNGEDRELLRRLRDACDSVEWEHSGVDPVGNRVYGVFAERALVAAASWDVRGSVSNVGVVTHPAHRGRGHGTAAASAVTAQLLDEGQLPQWQTLIDNAPSLRIGQALGYVERYRSIAVRLT